MKCPKCNAELPENSKVCPECGEQLAAGQTGDSLEAVKETQGEQENVSSESGRAAGDEGEAAVQAEPAGEPAVEAQAGGSEFRPEADASENTTQPAVSDAPAKKSGKKWIFGGIAAAAVVVICAAIAFTPGKKDPKTTVVEAFKSVYSDETVTPIEEIFGFEEMAENSVKTDSEGGMSLKITSSSDPSIQALAGSGITIMGRNDAANKKSDATIGIQYNGMDFASMIVYMDQSNIAVGLPGLTSKVLTMDYANDLEGQIENSPYLGKLAKENGMDLTVLKDYMDYVYKIYDKGSNDILDIGGLWKRYKEGSKAVDDLKAAMTVEKGEKKSLTVDGQEAACQGYRVTISKEAAAAFVRTSSQFFLEDESFKASFREYLTQVTNLSWRLYGQRIYGLSVTPEEMQQELWDEIKGAVDVIVKGMEEDMGNIDMTVYVDKKGRLASLDAKTAVNEEDGTQTDLTFHADLKGGAYLTQNAAASLTISDQDDTVTIALEKDGSYDKKNLTCNVKLSVDDEIDTYAFGYAGNYAVETGDYDMSFQVLENESELANVTFQGAVNDLVKGKSFDMVFDTLDITVEGENLLTLSGNYSLKPLETVVAMPSGEQMDMLAATEEEWTAVGNEIVGNVFGLLMGMGQ